MQPERPVQTTLAFHASRIVIDVGVLLAMASMSMTFVSAPDGSRSALAADALPALLLLLPIFAVTLIPDHTRPLHPILGWASMVLALAALPYAFVKMLDAGVLADTLGGSVGFGPMLLLIGCAITLIGIGIGIVRDLLGQPSGGTPQRSAAYATKRRPQASNSRPEARARQTPIASETATRVIEPVEPDEDTTRIIPADPAPATRPAPTAPVRSDPAATADDVADDFEPEPPAQPEIVFPDTGAVAREAEPEIPADEALLSTAERADEALTDHLLSMFDEGEFDDDDEQ